MTVLTTTSEISYAGLIGQDTFAYPFRVDLKTDMNITLDTVPVAQGDFSITNLGAPSGGDIVLNTPLVADAAVVLFRDVTATQETDYQPFDAFPAESHEAALDKLTMLAQQNVTAVDRSLKFPSGDTTSTILPDVPTRQDKFLGFDSSGQAVALEGTGGGDPNAVKKPASAVIADNIMVFDSSKNAIDSGEPIADLQELKSVINATDVPSSVNNIEVNSADSGNKPSINQGGADNVGIDIEGVEILNGALTATSLTKGATPVYGLVVLDTAINLLDRTVNNSNPGNGGNNETQNFTNLTNAELISNNAVKAILNIYALDSTFSGSSETVAFYIAIGGTTVKTNLNRVIYDANATGDLASSGGNNQVVVNLDVSNQFAWGVNFTDGTGSNEVRIDLVGYYI